MDTWKDPQKPRLTFGEMRFFIRVAVMVLHKYKRENDYVVDFGTIFRLFVDAG